MSDKINQINKSAPSAERYVPVIQVSFHTANKCYRVRAVSKGTDGSPDPTDQLISVMTSKTMDSPAGTFTVNLAGDQWFMPDGAPVMKPNDLVAIYTGYKTVGGVQTWLDGTKHEASEDLDTVMIGLVDTVNRVRNGGGNGSQPSISTTVTGRDFGKLLIKAMLKFYPQLGADSADGQKFFLTSTGWITLMKAFTNDNVIKGSPAKIIDTILRFILKKITTVKWKVYDDNAVTATNTGYKVVDLTSIMRYKLAETNFFVPFFMSAQDYEGSVWNLMEKANITPFTELFIDTRDRWEVSNGIGVPMTVNEHVEEDSSSTKGQLTDDNGKWSYPATMFGTKDGGQVLLTFRNTPFDKELWNKLKSHDLDTVDVIQENLSYSDNENYNLFWAGTTLTPFAGLDLKSVAPPLINQDNITTYGLSPLEVNIEGLELNQSQQATQVVALNELTTDLNRKLKRWYENNVNYLSGSLTLRGKGSIKIGQVLNYRGINRQFYIESVTQSFQVYGDFTTQVNVTRGATPPLMITNVVPAPQQPPPKPATQDPKPAARYHTVSGRDTLWAISGKYYGDCTKWTTIWEANKTMLIARDHRNASDHGHWIYTGQRLIIP